MILDSVRLTTETEIVTISADQDLFKLAENPRGKFIVTADLTPPGKLPGIYVLRFRRFPGTSSENHQAGRLSVQYHGAWLGAEEYRRRLRAVALQ